MVALPQNLFFCSVLTAKIRLLISKRNDANVSNVYFVQATSISPDLTEVYLVTVDATYWMGSLKEPG